MVLAVALLAPRVRTNLSLIRGGVDRGMTSNQIQGLIRATGQTGIRRTELLSGIRYLKGIADSGVRVRNTPLDRFPDPSRMTIAKGPMFRNFAYEVRMQGFSHLDGEVRSRFITVRSDRNLTPRQIQAEAQNVLDQADPGNQSGQLRDVGDITVIGARRRG